MSTYRTSRALRIVAASALTAVLLTGCTAGSGAKPGPARGSSPVGVNRGAVVAHLAPAGATAPIDAQAWTLVDRLTAPRFTADTTEAASTGLARSGIGTYSGTAAAGPDRPVTGRLSAFRLLAFQTHALAVGAWAGSAITGAELDLVLPRPPGPTGEPSTSQLLAAYVGAADTPGGALSRGLMSGQNLLVPTDLRFPTLVLVLFASDLARNDAVGGSTMTNTAYRLVTGGICTETANWIDGMISSSSSA